MEATPNKRLETLAQIVFALLPCPVCREGPISAADPTKDAAALKIASEDWEKGNYPGLSKEDVLEMMQALLIRAKLGCRDCASDVHDDYDQKTICMSNEELDQAATLIFNRVENRDKKEIFQYTEELKSALPDDSRLRLLEICIEGVLCEYKYAYEDEVAARRAAPIWHTREREEERRNLQIAETSNEALNLELSKLRTSKAEAKEDHAAEWFSDNYRMLMDNEARRVSSPAERAASRAALAPLRVSRQQAERSGYCRVIHAFLSAWNLSLSPAERDVLLTPLMPRLAGTHNPALQERRAFMALDWLVRINTPAWQLAAKLARKAAQPESSWTVGAPEPGVEITSADQLPAIKEALFAARDTLRGPSENWAYNDHSADAAQATRNHFQMIVWRRSEAAVSASAAGAAFSAAYAALKDIPGLDGICWRAEELARSAAAEAAHAKLRFRAGRNVQGAVYAAQWAATRARNREQVSKITWDSDAPHAWRQRDPRAWLTLLAMAAIDNIKCLGWDFAASVARGIAVSMANDRAEYASGALRETRVALQHSAVVLVNDMIEAK